MIIKAARYTALVLDYKVPFTSILVINTAVFRGFSCLSSFFILFSAYISSVLFKD